MPVLEVSVLPIGTQNPSFSSYVAEACKVVEDKGLKYQITPTGTVVEGNIATLMSVAQEMHAIPFRQGALRVITHLTIDERHDKVMNMEEQVQSVGQKMS